MKDDYNPVREIAGEGINHGYGDCISTEEL